MLLNLIRENPGIRYRELSLLTGLCNCVLSYHLKKIEKSKKVIATRENRRITRYFSVYVSAEEASFVGYFRNCSTRQIILTSILKHNNGCSFKELVQYTNKAPSTVLWHLKRLKRSKIISIQKNRQKHFLYVLNDTEFAQIFYQNIHTVEY